MLQWENKRQGEDKNLERSDRNTKAEEKWLLGPNKVLPTPQEQSGMAGHAHLNDSKKPCCLEPKSALVKIPQADSK